MVQSDRRQEETAFVRAPFAPQAPGSLRILGIPAGLFWFGVALLIVVLGVVIAIVA